MKIAVIILFIMTSMLFSQELKNRIGFYQGIEYQRKISEKSWLGVNIQPKFTSTHDNYWGSSRSYGFTTQFFLCKNVINKEYFQLNFLPGLSFKYSKPKISAGPDNYGGAFSFGFEPVLKISSNFDIIWRFEIGVSIDYYRNERVDYSGGDAKNSTQETISLRYYEPYSINPVNELGFRYYF